MTLPLIIWMYLIQVIFHGPKNKTTIDPSKQKKTFGDKFLTSELADEF